MSRTGSRPRVVVVGLGDTGVLTATHLHDDVEVVGVATTLDYLSGQELGLRLARPREWARDYRVELGRFRGLEGRRVVHGRVRAADLAARRLTVSLAAGGEEELAYDVLVVATGVTNGFWRSPEVRDAGAVDTGLDEAHRAIEAAGTVAVIGAGAAAVGTAYNVAATWPGRGVDLYFPGERPLPQHHPRVWRRVRRRLLAAGVALHPGHRAVVPGDSDRLTPGPVAFSTGQPPAHADAVVWAVGRVRPHTDWLPAGVLDERGFVRVRPDLRVVGHDDVFAVGDVAATDPLRSTARNFAHRLLVRNLHAQLAGRPLRDYRPPGRRWGSVLGPQPHGLEVFGPRGRVFRFPRWSYRTLLHPLVVRRAIYGGVRRRSR